MQIFVGVLCVAISLIVSTEGHGRLMDPVGRSSRWRFNTSAPQNYNDNENFCGGFTVQWNRWSGKCGVCGDNYGDPQPRANELGGKYGEGVIVKVYKNVPSINVSMDITANHLGYVHFDLCNLDDFGEETEECFLKNKLQFFGGSDRYNIGTQRDIIEKTILLPAGLHCQHCVLRWTYTAGNNWGTCENGTGNLGCGPQEMFKSCADISIIPANSDQPEIPVEI